MEIGQQQVRVVLDRADALGGEQFGKEPHHHLAVLEHVGDARRNAQIVLEHVELTRARTDQVDAGDVGVDATGHVDALHLAPVLRIGKHPLRRHDAGLEDRLLVVDVAQECVQCLHALLQAAVEHLPLVRGNDPRHDVERNQALRSGILAVDRKGYPDAVEGPLGLLALLGDPVGGGALEPPRERLIRRSDSPVRGPHFIVG